MIEIYRADGSKIFIRADAIIAIESPRTGANERARATILLSTGVALDVAHTPAEVLAEMKRVGAEVLAEMKRVGGNA